MLRVYRVRVQGVGQSVPNFDVGPSLAVEAAESLDTALALLDPGTPRSYRLGLCTETPNPKP